MSLDRILTYADFSGLVGKACEVHVAGHNVPMTLEEAQEVPGSQRESGGFRLEFAGPPDPMLAQGIFPFLFGEERFELFVVPIGRDRHGTRYEAMFF
jgi:uncharacterized protein DUF6916